MSDIAKVGLRSDKGCSHVHITIGNEGTLILHPHAANRLAADIAAVLAGEEFSAK